MKNPYLAVIVGGGQAGLSLSYGLKEKGIEHIIFEWLDCMGYYDLPIDEHPQKDRVRAKTNHYLTGRNGGREIDLRQFALAGMQLYGRLKDISSRDLQLKANLKQHLDGADAVAEKIKQNIDE